MKIKIIAEVIAFFALIILIMGMAVQSASAANISDLASKMAGKPITVHCVYSKEDYGYTERVIQEDHSSYFTPNIYLNKGTCVGLTGLLENRIYDSHLQANALETLIHEANHIRLDSDNESWVECTAMLKLRFWINYLGYGSVAKRMMAEAWAIHWTLPSNYLTPGYGCDTQGTTYITIEPMAKKKGDH